MTFNRLGLDRCGGLIVLMTGLAVAFSSRRYPIGSLVTMGPGFMPTLLGSLLTLVGIAMLVVATPAGLPTPSSDAGASAEATDASADAPATLRWRRLLCIVAGVVAFAILGETFGLVPASFAAVFLAALAEPGNSLRDSLLMAAGASLVAVLVFAYALHLQMPLFYGG